MSLKLCYCFIVTACWFTFLTKRKWYNYSISWNYLIVQTIYPELLGLWTSWSKAAFKCNLFFFFLKKKIIWICYIQNLASHLNPEIRIGTEGYKYPNISTVMSFICVFLNKSSTNINFFFLLRDSFNLWHPLLIITLCHRIKTSISTFYQ